MAGKKEISWAFTLLSSASLLAGFKAPIKVNNPPDAALLAVSNPQVPTALADWEGQTKAEIGAVATSVTPVDPTKDYILHPYLPLSAYNGLQIQTQETQDPATTTGYAPFTWPVED